jgi:hypothetical protein
VKTLSAIVLVVVLAFAGEWAYRGFIRPVDPLAPDIVALAAHFNASGIQVRPYAVRHGYRHSEVSSAAAFEIPGFPLVVGLLVTPNEQSAADMLARTAASPNLTHAQRNGLIVMDLPMWGPGTNDMATKVTNAFQSFRHGT